METAHNIANATGKGLCQFGIALRALRTGKEPFFWSDRSSVKCIRRGTHDALAVD